MVYGVGVCWKEKRLRSDFTGFRLDYSKSRNAVLFHILSLIQGLGCTQNIEVLFRIQGSHRLIGKPGKNGKCIEKL